MSELSRREQAAEASEQSGFSVGGIIRYVVILVLVGAGVWYYYFNEPPKSTARRVVGKTMGTDYLVKVGDFPEKDDLAALAGEIQGRLDAIDEAMSTFKPESELCRFNALTSEDWFDVSADTAKVVRIALDISRLTDGAYDVTVGPLVEFWGFGPEQRIVRENGPDTDMQVERLRQRIGFDKLEVRLDPPGLRKAIPELTIDLSSIAKGYAVDAVAELLEKRGIAHYMIEVGGEVRCRGNKGVNGDWTIGIEKPLIVPPGQFPGFQRKLHLGDAALATSGDYRIYRLIDGFRCSHIIDPRTGFPTERLQEDAAEPPERLGSVSVIAPSCAWADALATGLFVLGEKDGLRLAEQHDWAVLFLVRSREKEGAVQEIATKRFPPKSESAVKP